MGLRLFDQYTFLHFSVGVVMYFLGFKLIITIILHIIFEFVENTEGGMNFINQNLRWFWPGKKDFPDSKLNRLGDTIGIALGWLAAFYLDMIGKNLGWYYSPNNN